MRCRRPSFQFLLPTALILLSAILFGEAPLLNQKFIYFLGIVFAGLNNKVDWDSGRLGNSIKCIL
ncbi:hypothetical protein LINPERHAP1_LOCUS38042 [Linum perenne]